MLQTSFMKIGPVVVCNPADRQTNRTENNALDAVIKLNSFSVQCSRELLCGSAAGCSCWLMCPHLLIFSGCNASVSSGSFLSCFADEVTFSCKGQKKENECKMCLTEKRLTYFRSLSMKRQHVTSGWFMAWTIMQTVDKGNRIENNSYQKRTSTVLLNLYVYSQYFTLYSQLL